MRTYTSDGGVGHLGRDGKYEQNPSLGVKQSLPDLINLEVVVLDALSVCSDAFDRHGALALSQKFGGRRQVREEDQSREPGGQGQRSEDDENVHPAS